MAINQLNNYMPGQNLTNLANNVDYNRLGDDKTQISVSFAASPATVTVAIGSMWEINGNCYDIDTADETFVMANAAHNYITYNETTGFSSAATIGTWSPVKQGFYQADNVTRTLKWFIDEDTETYNIDLTILNGQTEDLTFSGSIQLDNFQIFNQIKVYTGTLNASGNASFDSSLSDLENYIIIDVSWELADPIFGTYWQSPGFKGTTGVIGDIYARMYSSTSTVTPNYIYIQGGSNTYSNNYRITIAKVFS